MANFEGLIRGALSTQDSNSAEIRQVVYQSSRNALQKLIDSNRSLTVESVMSQKRELEAAIDRIEAEFNAPPAPPAPVEEQIYVPAPGNSEIGPESETPDFSADSAHVETDAPARKFPLPPLDESDPLHEIQQILASTSPDAQPPVVEPTHSPENIDPELAQNVPSVDAGQTEELSVDLTVAGEAQEEPVSKVSEDNPTDQVEESESVPIGFSQRRRTQKRFLWGIISLLVIGLLAWIAYVMIVGVLNGTLLGQGNESGNTQNPNSLSRQNDSSDYITVMEPGDLSALVMAGRGQAEIVNQLNSNMVRVFSIRDDNDRSVPAQPILIRLQPGVLEQISGKNVTVEIYAKSGTPSPAHFAVGCDFGPNRDCGRKRFFVGLQPEASVFAFKMDEVADASQNFYVTLSTDTTNAASVTGKGDVLDIVYIRLKTGN